MNGETDNGSGGYWEQVDALSCLRGVLIGRMQPIVEGPQTAYCVEKVKRQQIREVSDVQPLHDRSMAATLVSLGRYDFYPSIVISEFFKKIGQ